MTNRSRTGPALLVAAALMLAACGTASGDTVPDPSVPTNPTTAPEPTTTVPTTLPATPTTVTVPTTMAPTPTTKPPLTTTTTTVPAPDNGDAEGSGCTPGDGPLPDGQWYGLVAGTGDASFEFDLACWFTGDAADRAAAEDGDESPVPNGYYVRNANPKLRTVKVAADTPVVWYPDAGDPASETTTTYAEWVDLVDERGIDLGVWIVVTNGAASEINEKWVP